MSSASGHRTWVFAGGHIPERSTGHEPEMTSRDELAIVNDGPVDAELELEVVHADRDPVGPYPLSVAARRVRHVRVNDLIDPVAVPLGVDYGLILRSSTPVVAQLTRVDTSSGQLATTVVPGWGTD